MVRENGNLPGYYVANVNLLPEGERTVSTGRCGIRRWQVLRRTNCMAEWTKIG